MSLVSRFGVCRIIWIRVCGIFFSVVFHKLIDVQSHSSSAAHTLCDSVFIHLYVMRCVLVNARLHSTLTQFDFGEFCSVSLSAVIAVFNSMLCLAYALSLSLSLPLNRVRCPLALLYTTFCNHSTFPLDFERGAATDWANKINAIGVLCAQMRFSNGSPPHIFAMSLSITFAYCQARVAYTNFAFVCVASKQQWQ